MDQKKLLWLGAALMICSCPIGMIGGVLMMGEGPHGPNGEITWAPGQGQMILFIEIFALMVFVSGVAVIALALMKK